MASKYVIETTRAHLAANWVETRIIDVENLFQTSEVSGDPLTEWVTLMPGDSVENQVSLGAPNNQRWREEGTLAFIAFVASGSGTARALELAEMLAETYRGKMIDDGGGGETIIFRRIDPPDAVLPSSVDASSGAWFGYAVAAEYYCDFCRQIA